MIDALHPDLKRQPFDFNITTRAALIAALASDGRSLHNAEDTIRIFRMPSDGREGVEVSGMYFWHDYPMTENKQLLRPDWRCDHDRVNAKYTKLWTRFSDMLRSDVEKTFLLSNCQKNLPEFAVDDKDFSLKFGLGLPAYEEITTALDAYGARNYRLQFFSRTRAEVAETEKVLDARFGHRFVGPFRLRPGPDFVRALLQAQDTQTRPAPTLASRIRVNS